MDWKKKKIIVLGVLGVFVVAVLLFFAFLMNNKEKYSNEFTESSRQDTIVYQGKTYRYNEHLSNYLFMGIDKTEPIENYELQGDAGRADSIYLISYDRVRKTVKCIAIPRDTMTNIRIISAEGLDLGLTEDHINMQYAFGDGKSKSCQLMKEAISTMLYGVPIEGYCSINMDGIAAAVGVLGGVELVVPDQSLERVNPKFQQGAKVVVTELDAEQFIRYRDTQQSQSAIVRMERQKIFMEAFMETAKNKADSDADLVVDMHENLKPYMVTNMGTDLFAKLLEADFGSDNKIQDIPGEKVDGIDFDEYHISEEKLYELVLQTFYEEVQGE